MNELTDEVGSVDPDSLDRPYTLTIDLNVLEHLGINLYSNVPAVLTEVVANAWDANARKVIITIGGSLDYIEIEDDGFGMDRVAINSKFLWVGYKKRDSDGDRTPPPLSRPVMGRKGVGKLAPFSIAETLEVYSTHEGSKCALSMNVSDIKEAAKPPQPKAYHPKAIDTSLCPESNGTKLVLRGLKKERIRIENLAQRLARRFSVIGTPEFSVIIKRSDGAEREITNRDRGDLDKLQYLWSLGNWEKPSWLEGQVTREARLDGELTGWPSDWKVKGWLGTVNKPQELKAASGNLNVVVVLARGRLFQENILGEINDGRHYLKYLVGHIEADFLDSSNGLDIATSDRQRVQEDDPRYKALIAYLQSNLPKLEANWSAWRTEDKSSQIKTIHPAVAGWIANLGVGHKKHAEKIIGRIASLDIEDPSEETLLIKHAILGFERLKITGQTQELADAVAVGSDRLLPLLSDIDSVEASLYRDIVKGRLEVIKAFESKIDENELENTLRDYIFDHLWLLDPSWERAQGSSIVETPVNAEFDRIKADLTPEESRGRVDIKYRTTSGKHVIIELKRANRLVGVFELVEQGLKYRNALLKCLKQLGRENEPYEVVFVIGRPLKDEGELQSQQLIQNMLAGINGRVVQFEALVASAKAGYTAYLEARSKIDKIQEILDSLN
ncbi:BbrUII/HgiDII family restriction enzyme [Azotobacter vinelandii]|uniref:BbrUII/HgiDII family restriction enzyme n=1 Tax=Azotobacter vinelandii TaxID=354 RepID=UPI0009EA5239|nr:ATP-binding protein [Azotobacter vinelandii]